MRPIEPPVTAARRDVAGTAPGNGPTTPPTAATVAGAGLVLLLALDTLPGEALFAVAALGTSAGGFAWAITWVIDLRHGRAARIALLTASATATVATALGILAIELGSAVVPLVGILAIGTSAIVANRTAQSRDAPNQSRRAGQAAE